MAVEPAIRAAHANDVAAIVALTERAYAPYTELLGAPPLPVTDDYGPRIAAGEVWLLELAGTLAGLIVLEAQAHHVLIYSIAVSPDFQGRGLGLELLRFAEEQARRSGLDEVRLYTNARMERNIALYEKFGFAESGRRPNPKRPGWVLVDMAKRLALGSAARR